MFPHSKEFQSSRNWFKYLEKQIGFSHGTNVAVCTKQEIASNTWNRGKIGDLHTYIQISEIRLVLTQGTQAGHVLDRN